jgi:hypothetical protein
LLAGDKAPPNGMPPIDAAAAILAAIEAGKRELGLATGMEHEMAVARRSDPEALFDRVFSARPGGVCEADGRGYRPGLSGSNARETAGRSGAASKPTDDVAASGHDQSPMASGFPIAVWRLAMSKARASRPIVSRCLKPTGPIGD